MSCAAAHCTIAGMSMHGVAAMSSPWVRAPGQGWVHAGASFVVMWLAMTVAMMLPATAPALWRYRTAIVRRGGRHAGARTAIAGAAYLLVWSLCGVIVFVAGASVATLQAAHPVVPHVAPVATGVVMVLAGAWQLTARKARQLVSCRRDPAASGEEPCDPMAAARFGLRLGLHCTRSCANLMLIPLVAGIMDLTIMVAVALAIAAERLAPSGDRIARATGVIIAVAGLYPIVRLLAPV